MLTWPKMLTETPTCQADQEAAQARAIADAKAKADADAAAAAARAEAEALAKAEAEERVGAQSFIPFALQTELFARPHLTRLQAVCITCFIA
jgi:hypothetical protein